jgi:hypothetical protein
LAIPKEDIVKKGQLEKKKGSKETNSERSFQSTKLEHEVIPQLPEIKKI